MTRGLKWCADEDERERWQSDSKRERREGESLVFGEVRNTVAGNSLDTATHFPNQAEITILIDIQLHSLFHISS